MLDMLWVDGLTIRDMHIRRPGHALLTPPLLLCNGGKHLILYLRPGTAMVGRV